MLKNEYGKKCMSKIIDVEYERKKERIMSRLTFCPSISIPKINFLKLYIYIYINLKKEDYITMKNL